MEFDQFVSSTVNFADAPSTEIPLVSDCLLVLCRGQDGDMARDRCVWGFIYEQGLCTVDVTGYWWCDESDQAHHAAQDVWQLSVLQPKVLASGIDCRLNVEMGKHRAVEGLRIKLDQNSIEQEQWAVKIQQRSRL